MLNFNQGKLLILKTAEYVIVLLLYYLLHHFKVTNPVVLSIKNGTSSYVTISSTNKNYTVQVNMYQL